MSVKIQKKKENISYRTYLIGTYLIEVKGGIKYVISHNYARIKVNLYDSLFFS